LAARPILAHLKMIEKEWKRPDLHRDLKVLIIQKAFDFLEVAEGESIGWSILVSAVADENPEVVTTLLTAEPVYNKYVLFCKYGKLYLSFFANLVSRRLA